ncbi:lamin-A-like [Mustelus asterias]
MLGAPTTPPSDLVWKQQRSWGTGDNIRTSLITSNNDEVAMRKVTRVAVVNDEEEEDDSDGELRRRHLHQQTAHSTSSGADGEYNLRSRSVLCGSCGQPAEKAVDSSQAVTESEEKSTVITGGSSASRTTVTKSYRGGGGGGGGGGGADSVVTRSYVMSHTATGGQVSGRKRATMSRGPIH